MCFPALYSDYLKPPGANDAVRTKTTLRKCDGVCWYTNVLSLANIWG